MKTWITCFKLSVVLLMGLPFGLNAQKFDWVTSIGDWMVDRGTEIYIDDGGNVYATGLWRGTADLDPGPGVTMATAMGLEDLYLQKFDANGNLLWVKTLVCSGSATNTNGSKSIMVDDAGNVVVVGYFIDTMDFDPGPGVVSVYAPRTSTFIWKLDQGGNLVWGKTLGENVTVGFTTSASVAIDAAMNLYLIGRYSATIDMDPGPGVTMVSPVGNSDVFLLKLDPQGNRVWSHSFGAQENDEGWGIKLVNGNTLVCTGTFQGSVDFDPGIGATALTTLGLSRDMYVAAYTTAGVFLWAKDVEAQNAVNLPYAFTADLNGNVYVAGLFTDTTDFDPGPGAFLLQPVTNNGNSDIFLWSLDISGNFRWAFTLGTQGGEVIHDLGVDGAGNVYGVGWFTTHLDVDPSPAAEWLIANQFPFIQTFIASYATTGTLNWARKLDGGRSYGEAIAMANDGSMALTGRYEFAVDFDLSDTASHFLTPVGWEDAYVLKLLPDTCAGLDVLIDAVDVLSCAEPSGMAMVTAVRGLPPYSYAWNTTPAQLDSIVPYNQSGLYIVTVTDARDCMAWRGVLVEGPTFANGWDLEAQIRARCFRPGANAVVFADVHNDGCLPMGGVFAMVLDTMLQYVSALPVPDSVVGDSLYWTIPIITYDSTDVHFEVTVHTPVWSLPTDSVQIGYFINPIAGDVQPMDNIRLDYRFPIQNACVQNSKSVYPGGVCQEHYVLRSDTLTYTIQFQNTGTADAVDIVVFDTLDSDLDPYTLDVKGSSHPLRTEWWPGNVVAFIFEGIHLPDSNTNEPASHGYLVFDVQSLAGIPSGTEIHNGSAIYFDYNPAVLTNVVMNTIVDVIPACGAVGVGSESEHDGLWLVPNPASGTVRLLSDAALGEVTIVNVLGQLMRTHVGVGEEQLEIDLHGWAKGIYLVGVRQEGRARILRLMVE